MSQALVGILNNPETGLGEIQTKKVVQQDGGLDAQGKAGPGEFVQIRVAQRLVGDAQTEYEQHACRDEGRQETGSQQCEGYGQGV